MLSQPLDIISCHFYMSFSFTNICHLQRWDSSSSKPKECCATLRFLRLGTNFECGDRLLQGISQLGPFVNMFCHFQSPFYVASEITGNSGHFWWKSTGKDHLAGVRGPGAGGPAAAVARAALRPGGGALGRGGAARLRGGGPWEGRSNAKMGSFTGYWGKD